MYHGHVSCSCVAFTYRIFKNWTDIFQKFSLLLTWKMGNMSRVVLRIQRTCLLCLARWWWWWWWWWWRRRRRRRWRRLLNRSNSSISSALYGTRRFSTVFTRAYIISLSWVGTIQYRPPSYLSTIHVNIIPLGLGLQSCLFPSASSPNPACTSPLPHTCHVPRHLNLLSLTSQIIGFLVHSTQHKAPHCVVFSTPLLHRLSSAHIFSSALYFKTPSTNVPPSTWATKFHTHTQQQKLWFYTS